MLFWTNEHDALLKSCLIEGMSFLQAADRINQTFGTDYSRNSAIGRSHRLKLEPKNRPGYHDGVRVLKPKSHARPRRAKCMAPKEPEPEPEPVTFAELKPHHCRAVVSDKTDEHPMLFCGARRMRNSPWCPKHYKLFTTTPRKYGEKR
jgi:hypothetical protein